MLPDDYNRRLIENVHPATWENPTPVSRYNMLVIGAGTAGLVTAAIAAGVGLLVFAVSIGLADLIDKLIQVRNFLWHTEETADQIHDAIRDVRSAVRDLQDAVEAADGRRGGRGAGDRN